MDATMDTVRDVIVAERTRLLDQWQQQLRALGDDLRLNATELGRQAEDVLGHVSTALANGAGADLAAPAWSDCRAALEDLSRERVRQGFTSDQTATFLFSLKQPLFKLLGERHGNDAAGLARSVWAATVLVDALGLYSVRAFQRTREDVIVRQQTELMELSTPVVKLWDGILALPMIGTLDSARTQVVMETLLQRIVETGSEIAIIDITGVPTVDTLVAQHLLKTVTAIRLMGAECIISGVRPQIAQTIVHLGIDLRGVITKATLADALRAALRHVGMDLGAVRAQAGT